MTAGRARAAGVRGLAVAVVVIALGPGVDGTRHAASVRSSDEPVGERTADAGGRSGTERRTNEDPVDPITLRGSEGRVRLGERGRFVARRLVVRFRPGVSEAAKERVRSLADARLVRPLPLSGAELIALPAGTSIATARQRFATSPRVAYAEPDFIYSTSALVPNDPRFSSQWGLDVAANTDIDAPEAWSSFRGSSAIRVGIVDTGIDYDHPDLKPNIGANLVDTANGVDDDGNGYVDDVRGWDWVDDDNTPLDLNAHGTHVAGTVGAKGNNGIAVTGVSWNATLVPLRVLNAEGSGSTSDIAAAFSYAGELGIDVVNASLGGAGFSQTLLDSIQSSPNTLFVVSAGNDARDNDATPYYPCNYDAANIVCVAATTRTDDLATFSSYGASTVDLGAPGVGILSTLPNGEVGSYSGTSMAAPHVAGAAAVLKSAKRDLDGSSLRTALMTGSVRTSALVGKTVTGGRLNLAGSLDLVAPIPVEPLPIEPEPEPEPEASPSPSPEASPSESPEPDPSPSASPDPGPEPEEAPVERTIRLRMRRHLIATGAVGSPESRCRSGIRIVIKRNGRWIAATTTDDAGRFRVRVRDRTGWYAARTTANRDCARVMRRVRHRH